MLDLRICWSLDSQSAQLIHSFLSCDTELTKTQAETLISPRHNFFMALLLKNNFNSSKFMVRKTPYPTQERCEGSLYGSLYYTLMWGNTQTQHWRKCLVLVLILARTWRSFCIMPKHCREQGEGNLCLLTRRCVFWLKNHFSKYCLNTFCKF